MGTLWVERTELTSGSAVWAAEVCSSLFLRFWPRALGSRSRHHRRSARRVRATMVRFLYSLCGYSPQRPSSILWVWCSPNSGVVVASSHPNWP